MAGFVPNQSRKGLLMMPANWRFWFGWVLASAVGMGLGGPLGTMAASSADSTVAGYVGATVGVALAGGLQWLALRRRIDRASRWALAGILSVATVSIMALGLAVISTDVATTVGVVIMGAVLGVLQWLVLRGQVVRAGWWILASAAGWIVGGALSGAVPSDNPVGWTLIGIVYGAITGFVLVWLLHHPAPPTPATK